MKPRRRPSGEIIFLQLQTHFWCIYSPGKRVWWLQMSSYFC